jgi:DNA-binding MarR family transcriptional regulator
VSRSSSTSDRVAASPLDLDRRIHEPGRLGILSALAGAGEERSFSELRELLGLSDGNLLMHLRTLEEAGWIEARRRKPEGQRRRTCYRMTRQGQGAFDEYLARLEEIIRQSRP